jgi:hypothetical protein
MAMTVLPLVGVFYYRRGGLSVIMVFEGGIFTFREGDPAASVCL